MSFFQNKAEPGVLNFGGHDCLIEVRTIENLHWDDQKMAPATNERWPGNSQNSSYIYSILLTISMGLSNWPLNKAGLSPRARY